MQINSFQRFVNLNPFFLIDFPSWCQGKSDPCICNWVIPPRVKMRLRAQLVIDNQAISMQMPKPEVQSQMYNQDETCVCVFKQQLISADSDTAHLNFPARTCFLHAVFLVSSLRLLGHQWWSNVGSARFRRILFRTLIAAFNTNDGTQQQRAKVGLCLFNCPSALVWSLEGTLIKGLFELWGRRC